MSGDLLEGLVQKHLGAHSRDMSVRTLQVVAHPLENLVVKKVLKAAQVHKPCDDSGSTVGVTAGSGLAQVADDLDTQVS